MPWSFGKEIHDCNRCREELGEVVLYSPVISFGDPAEKRVIVVGINPSTREFEDGYLFAEGVAQARHADQLNYFDRPYYGFFFAKVESFFKGEPARLLGVDRSIWEKVGFLNLVKCPTRDGERQWSQLTPKKKRAMISNCEGFLLEQLRMIGPVGIVAYGADVCRWFSSRLGVAYELWGDSIIELQGRSVKLLMIPQRQGGYSVPELTLVRQKLTNMLR